MAGDSRETNHPPRGGPFRTPIPVQFSVYLQGQDTKGVAPHRSPRSLGLLAVARGKAILIGQNAIQLSTRMSWKELKAFLRGANLNRPEPINAPGYHVLPYTYPLPYDMLRHYQGGA